jgi:hypothetical protein
VQKATARKPRTHLATRMDTSPMARYAALPEGSTDMARVPPIAAPSGLTYRHSPDLEEVP